MWSFRRRARGPESVGPAERWTGHLTFDIRTRSGGYLGALRMAIDNASVQVFFAEHPLATFDRDRVRHWMRSPGRPLKGGDCSLVMEDGRLAVALGETSPDFMPTDVAQQFKAAVAGG